MPTHPSPHPAEIEIFCGRCGKPYGADSPAHASCIAALALEPPRYCQRCARRMVVQVTPTGWSAGCVNHGRVVSKPV